MSTPEIAFPSTTLPGFLEDGEALTAERHVIQEDQQFHIYEYASGKRRILVADYEPGEPETKAIKIKFPKEKKEKTAKKIPN